MAICGVLGLVLAVGTFAVGQVQRDQQLAAAEKQAEKEKVQLENQVTQAKMQTAERLNEACVAAGGMISETYDAKIGSEAVQNQALVKGDNKQDPRNERTKGNALV